MSNNLKSFIAAGIFIILSRLITNYYGMEGTTLHFARGFIACAIQLKYRDYLNRKDGL